MNHKRLDLTGQRFGKLVVVCPAENNNSGRTMWLCKCDCGTEKCVSTKILRNGECRSCGCLISETAKIVNKKYNTYNLAGEFGIGYTTKGKEFYFDLADYDKIRDFCWTVDSNGYPISYGLGKTPTKMIRMHRLLMGIIGNEDGIVVDHINGKTNDNRRSNLRLATTSENIYNSKLASDNTSGITGVDLRKRDGKWRARLSIRGKEVPLGFFENREDAIKARLQGELQYFGEFAPQKHLYEQYGIL
jgi:hypothetical protein